MLHSKKRVQLSTQVKMRVSVPWVYIFILNYVVMTTTCTLKACRFVVSYFIKLGTMLAI